MHDINSTQVPSSAAGVLCSASLAKSPPPLTRCGCAGRWLLFDDDKVSVVAADDIAKLYGGGDWHTAYVSLYRAKK